MTNLRVPLKRSDNGRIHAIRNFYYLRSCFEPYIDIARCKLQNILLIEHSAEHSAGKGRRDLSAEHSMRLRRPGPWPGAEAVTLLGPGPGAVTECHRFCGRLSRRVRFAVTALGALPVPQRPGDPVSGEARPPPPSMMTGSQGPGPSYRRAVSSDSARNSCQARDWPGGMTAWRD